jgi:hypothetical protein
MDESIIRTIESSAINDELSQMFEDAYVEFERIDVARIAPISSEQADLLVWVSHPFDSITHIEMQWVLADEGGAPAMIDIESPFPVVEFFPCRTE